MRFATLSALLTLVLSISASVVANDVVPWQANLNEAMDVARKENRPLLLHFWSPDCGPCLRLDDTVFSKASVAETLSDYFVPVKINGAAQPSVRAAYRVDRYPTDVIVLPNNEVVHRMITPQNPQQYIHQLTAVAFRTGLVTKKQSPEFADRYAVEENASEPADEQAVPETPDGRFDKYREQFGKYVDDQVVPAQAQTGGFATNERRREVVNPYATGASSRPPVQREPNSSNQENYAAQNYAAQDYSAQNYAAQDYAAQDYASDKAYATGNDWEEPASRQSQTYVTEPATSPEHSDTSAPSQTYAQQEVPQNNQSYRSHSVAPESKSQPTRTRPQAPTASLDGYCPVTLLNQEQWKKGNPAFGAIHRGRLFLFTSEKEKRMFIANPDKYSPVLAGVDPVELTESGQVREGRRAHGVVYRDQVFLFVNEDNLERFWKSPETYTTRILQAMQSTADDTIYR